MEQSLWHLDRSLLRNELVQVFREAEQILVEQLIAAADAQLAQSAVLICLAGAAKVFYRFNFARRMTDQSHITLAERFVVSVVI